MASTDPKSDALTCFEQGQAYIETIAKYYDKTDTLNQGWYTEKGKLVYGFYCDIEQL